MDFHPQIVVMAQMASERISSKSLGWVRHPSPPLSFVLRLTKQAGAIACCCLLLILFSGIYDLLFFLRHYILAKFQGPLYLGRVDSELQHRQVPLFILCTVLCAIVYTMFLELLIFFWAVVVRHPNQVMHLAPSQCTVIHFPSTPACFGDAGTFFPGPVFPMALDGGLLNLL